MEENTNVVAETTSTEIPAVEKTFTQEEVNTMISARLSKSEKNFLSKLGLEKKDDLDVVIGKLAEYDSLKSKNGELETMVSTLQSEKAKAQYMRVIEKANVDDEVSEFVYSKVMPTESESVEDYSKRVTEYLKQHSNFLKEKPKTINSSFDLSNSSVPRDSSKYGAINDLIRNRGK